MNILVVCEHHENKLNTATLKVIAAAQKLNAPIDLIIMGHNIDSIKKEANQIIGLNKIITIDSIDFAAQLAENCSLALAELAKSYSHIFAPASTFGKNLLPRLAAYLDVSPLSEVIEIISPSLFKRPIYAGNAIATVESLDSIKIATIRTASFGSASTNPEHQNVIESYTFSKSNTLSRFVKIEQNKSERPDLTSARVIVSGGRGLQSSENFKLLEALADKLGAAVGASRAAVDAGFVPNDYQVGQTGKIVAPELYFAIGISGAIQHLAGMKDSKIIVAINKDPDAPIFQIADYGLVGDLFEIVPELTKSL